MALEKKKLSKVDKRTVNINDMGDDVLNSLNRVKLSEIHLVSGFNWQAVKKGKKETEARNGDKITIKHLLLECKDKIVAFPFSKGVRDKDWAEIMDEVDTYEIHVNNSVRRDPISGEPLEEPENATGALVALIGKSSRDYGEIVDQDEDFTTEEEPSKKVVVTTEEEDKD